MKKIVFNIASLVLVLFLLFSCSSTDNLALEESLSVSVEVESVVEENKAEPKLEEPLLEISKKKDEVKPSLPQKESETTVEEDSSGVPPIATDEKTVDVDSKLTEENKEPVVDEAETPVVPTPEESGDNQTNPSLVEKNNVPDAPIIENTEVIEPVEDIKDSEAVSTDVSVIVPEDVVLPPAAKEDVASVKVSTEANSDTTTTPVVEDNTKPSVEPSFPTPVLERTVSPTILQALAVVIVSTVIFTIAVAIRGANKMKLQKGISIAMAILFPALAMIVSTLVAGWSYIWLGYLILLLTYFIFRSRWRDSSFV